MFYSNEEFEAQMVDLMAKGTAYSEAYAIVRKREQEDAEEYEQWRRDTGGDAWYDDQFELDIDYN
jgi:adenylosuccinate lyase